MKSSPGKNEAGGIVAKPKVKPEAGECSASTSTDFHVKPEEGAGFVD